MAYHITTAGLQWLQQNDLEAATLYLGLIDADGFVAISPDDTMSSHTGWTELADYSESVRQTWNQTGSSGGYMSNPAGATFTASAAAGAVGWFLTTSSTKSGTTGTLIAVVTRGGNQEGLERAIGEPWVVVHELPYKSGG